MNPSPLLPSLWLPSLWLIVMRIATMLVLMPINAYRVVLSPLLGSHCRFSPSCSHYAIEAIQLHGVVKGGYLTMHRLWRCRPFGGSGYDPVPEQISSRSKRVEDAK
jgi:putative membrane protein insertion efficiency factor